MSFTLPLAQSWAASTDRLVAPAFLVLLVAAAMLFARPPVAPNWGQVAEPPAPFEICAGPEPAGLHDPLLAANGRPRPVPRIVSSEPLAHAAGKRITVAVVTFPPGGYSPPHRHGGTVSVYVLKGTIRSQLGNGPIGTFLPGDTFFEPLGIIHMLSENTSTVEPAEILAIFVHDEGATLTTYLE
jgi:quercetin dioxygenase-like cupin family protein